MLFLESEDEEEEEEAPKRKKKKKMTAAEEAADLFDNAPREENEPRSTEKDPVYDTMQLGAGAEDEAPEEDSDAAADMESTPEAVAAEEQESTLAGAAEDAQAMEDGGVDLEERKKKKKTKGKAKDPRRVLAMVPINEGDDDV